MINFNTNQTRFLYVAGAVDTSLDTNLDIALAQAATGEAYFKYVNAEGKLTRSDTFNPKKIISLKKTTAASMATPLQAVVFSLASGVASDANAGKDITLAVTVHDAFDYNSQYTITATVPVTSTASAVYNALGKALYKAIPAGDGYPAFAVYVATAAAATKVTEANKNSETVQASATRIILAALPQKFVVGKLSGEPCHISVAFRGDLEGWGVVDATKNTVAAVNIGAVTPATVSGTQALANLEFFASGEKGDVARGYNYPNDYPFVPAVDLSKTYDVVTIEYFWNGDAENVQKSPRMIQIAADSTGSVATTIYNAVYALMPDSLVDRVEALEGSSN